MNKVSDFLVSFTLPFVFGVLVTVAVGFYTQDHWVTERVVTEIVIKEVVKEVYPEAHWGKWEITREGIISRGGSKTGDFVSLKRVCSNTGQVELKMIEEELDVYDEE